MLSRAIVVLFLLNVLVRLAFLEWPFWGLEYEDSFIFCESSRLLAEGQELHTENLAVATCVVGSIYDCYEHGVYGGHFPLFPVLIAGVHAAFGYHEINIFALNAILSYVLLFVVLRAFLKTKEYASALIAAVLFLVTPFYQVFNTSGLSETLFGSLVMVFLLNLLRVVYSKVTLDWKTILSMLVILLLALFTKRESITLIVIFVAAVVLFKPFRSKNLILIGLGFAALSGIIYVASGVMRIETLEGTEIESSTFSLRYLFLNLGALVKGFFTLKYWGVTGLLLLLTAGFTLFSWRRRTIQSRFWLVALLCFIVVYSSHYRSFYQAHFDVVTPFDSLRYATSYFPILVMFLASTLGDLSSKFCLNKTRASLANVTAAVTTVILFGVGIRCRIHFNEVEDSARIRPVRYCLSKFDGTDVFVSDIPSVFRVLGSADQQVADLYSLDVQTFERHYGESSMLFVLTYTGVKELERYGLHDLMERLELLEQTEGCSVYSLVN